MAAAARSLNGHDPSHNSHAGLPYLTALHVQHRALHDAFCHHHRRLERLVALAE